MRVYQSSNASAWTTQVTL